MQSFVSQSNQNPTDMVQIPKIMENILIREFILNRL